jgi:hypothetical protein
VKRGLLLALLLAPLAPPAVVGQAPGTEIEVASAVDPDTVTVGDPFEVLVEVRVPAGIQVRFPNLADSHAAFQPLGPARVHADRNGEAIVFTAAYPLVAWQTGGLPTPILPVRLVLPGGREQVLRVAMPLPEVASVLPPDSEAVEPRGAKGILAAEPRFPWWLLIVAALVVLVGALWIWRRRRPHAPEPLTVALSPREQALATLERARELQPARSGEWKPFFSMVSDALRGYLAALSPGWDTDLTTEELLRALRRQADPADFERIARTLRLADLVKFARYRPTQPEAEEAWQQAVRVVQQLEAPAPAATPLLEEVA